MSAMSVEPAGSGPTPVSDAQKHFLHLAFVIAKHNAIYRARYPEDDPIYQMVEGSFFGTFDDCRSSSTFSQMRPSLQTKAQGVITRRSLVVLQSSWPRRAPGRVTSLGMREGWCFGASHCPSRGPP